ncbi:hypothetical protein ABBQ38_003961 [Trebouxia sp. C0009 RCD-2024]
MGPHKKAMKAMFPRGKWRLLRGDAVIIRAGKDAGQTGVISKVHRDVKRPGVIVKGMNLFKKHIKRTQDRPGGIVDIEKPIAYSNVALIDPVTKAACRTSWRYLEDGTKVRITHGKLASGTAIPRPAVLARASRTRSYVGKKDTALSDLLATTHIDGSVPFGVDRVASILAGRTRLPVVTASQAPSRGFTSLPLKAGNSRIIQWRGFAAHAACR